MINKIKELDAEFDEKFVKDNGKEIEPSFLDPNGSVGPIKTYLHTRDKAILTILKEEVEKKIEEYNLRSHYGNPSSEALSEISSLIDNLLK